MRDTRDIVTAEMGAEGTDLAPADAPASVSRRRLWYGGAGVLVVLMVAYIAGVLLVGDEVPRGTTIGGVDVGGLTRDEARIRLERALEPALEQPIAVTIDGTETQIAPADADLVLASSATLEEAAQGSRWNPLHLVGVLLGGGRDFDAPVAAEGDGLATALAAIAATTDAAPVDATITFADGTVAATEPVNGSALDVAAASDAILDGLLEEQPIELPVETTAPLIDAAKLKHALDTFAEPAMSGPVTISTGATEVSLAPTDISPFLTMAVEGDELVPVLDVDGLLAADPARFAGVIKAPVSARFFTFEGGAPKLVPAVVGSTIDPETLRADLLEALASVGAERVVEASTTAVEPELTTVAAQALGITEEISAFTTNYPIAEYRLINIGRASELINGTLVLPGETFSLNGTVGERTAENGFVKGFVIDGGQFREDFGGGVSQVATTTFNAVFFAGLEDVEHKPHSFYISRYPAGREATVAWPTVDLKFRNDTDTGVLIQTIHSPGEITVRFWGTKAYDEVRSVSSERTNYTTGETKYENDEECVDQDPVSGFDITVTRQFVQTGQVIRSENFFTRYNAADRIVCGPPPAPPSP